MSPNDQSVKEMGEREAMIATLLHLRSTLERELKEITAAAAIHIMAIDARVKALREAKGDE